jgi:nicotinic acid mononucleotide adenylyltransferase
MIELYGDVESALLLADRLPLDKIYLLIEQTSYLRKDITKEQEEAEAEERREQVKEWAEENQDTSVTFFDKETINVSDLISMS